MEFTPIAPIRPIIDSTGTQQAGGAERAGTSLFATVFQSAIDNVRETDAKKVDLEYKLATGQLDNPAQLNIAAYKNEIAVDLLIQMRNRALDAYNELKNMNV